MRKLFLGIVGALAGVSMMSSMAKAECGEVTMTDMNWASSATITAVAKFIMEQGYGCTVVLVPSSTVTSVASISETGKPDIATEIWLNSATMYPSLVEAGKVITVANVLSDGGVENWYIPDYLAEAHPELTTIEGVLANPNLVGGKFHNCPEGWGCRVANDNLKVAFDFAGHGMEVFNHGSGETLATSIASAYSSKSPWFGYYWGPTAVLGKYPMVKVDMGPHDPEIHTCNQSPDCENPQKSSYPSAEVLTAITTDFASREPEIAELMSKLTFTNAIMGHLLAWQEENSASADETAVYFLTNNKNIWSTWLNDSAKSKLAALLQ